MKKNIEEYIKNNRPEIDRETPPDLVWEGIRGRSFKLVKDSNNEGQSFNWWKIAAVVLLVFSVGLLFLRYVESDQNQTLASLGDLSSEYQLVENKYQESIDNIYSELDLENINREQYRWLFEELEYLDSLNVQFREDIGTEADEDKLVEILIDYYEKKLKLLRRLELEINRTKYEDDENINI